MRYGSVCSGIEAATVAWHPLGWKPAFFSEIEPFPRSVLQHHYPQVPLHGDFTTIEADQYGAVDLLAGGTPCQSFSVAGLRGGLADDRGNLALEFLRLADRARPRWVVWENVPGVLSSNGGRDFGSILGGMVELGYGFAYRVLDAQHFGVPQRRRRIFVVGYLGDWRPPAAVLFERHSLSGNSAPRRETGQAVAALTANGVGTCGADDNQGQAGHLIAAYGGNNTSGPIEVATALNAHGGPSGRLDFESETFVTTAFRTSPNWGAWETGDRTDALTTGTDRTSHVLAVALRGREGGAAIEMGDDQAFALRASQGGGDKPHVLAPVAFQSSQSGIRVGDTHATLDANNGSRRHNGVLDGMAVRRLTPVECERLQGFPDNWTRIPWRGKPAEQCPDGPRYKAIGNSMAVPVMRWIGERIAAVEAILQEQRRAA